MCGTTRAVPPFTGLVCQYVQVWETAAFEHGGRIVYPVQEEKKKGEEVRRGGTEMEEMEERRTTEEEKNKSVGR